MNTNSLPPPSPSSTTANAPPQTSIAQVDGTDSTTTESITLTTQTNSLPAFPTAPDASQSATFISSSLPFLITPVPPDATPPPFATIPAVSPDTVTDAGAIQRSSHVVAIVAGVAGGVIFVIFALLAFIIYRRRRRRFQASQGTVSVFDLLNDSPPPQPPARRRPLPAPPMFDHPAGRSIDATPNKTDAPFMDRARFHSAQSSVSSYADSRSDLRIHIPMASFQQSDRSHSPMSHAHSNSHSHAHSPITRNGVPMPPEQEEIVRELLMGARAGEGASLRRGSVRSDYTPSTTTGRDDEELWGPPVIHVDSGIRISRAMMELPPMYAAS
ncbi:hypothetical protein DFH09DRAFT_463733 [Mycena vulgaris]|nr:hypothetical protein DFH09DRAFT_463733 [Mycena vulgaris]